MQMCATLGVFQDLREKPRISRLFSLPATPVHESTPALHPLDAVLQPPFGPCDQGYCRPWVLQLISADDPPPVRAELRLGPRRVDAEPVCPGTRACRLR